MEAAPAWAGAGLEGRLSTRKLARFNSQGRKPAGAEADTRPDSVCGQARTVAFGRSRRGPLIS